MLVLMGLVELGEQIVERSLAAAWGEGGGEKGLGGRRTGGRVVGGGREEGRWELQSV